MGADQPTMSEITDAERAAWQAIAQRISERTAYCEAEEAFPRLLAALTQAEGERDAAQAAYMSLRVKLYRLLSWMLPRVAEILSEIETYDNATWGRPDEATQPPLPDPTAPQQLPFNEGSAI